MIASIALLLLAQTPVQSEPPKPPQAAAEQEVVLYDVLDLALMDKKPTWTDVEEAEAIDRVTRDLIGLLETFGPLSDGETVFGVPARGGAGLQSYIGVNAGPATHAWAREWFDLQRTGIRIEVTAEVLDTSPGPISLTGDFPAPASLRLMVQSGSRAKAEVGERLSYIKDWRIETVEPGSQEIVDPIVESLFEGLQMDVLATALPGGSIGVEFVVKLSSITRPIETREVRLRDDLVLMVSLPELQARSMSSRMVLVDGASFSHWSLDVSGEPAISISGRLERPRTEEAPGFDMRPAPGSDDEER